MSARSLNRVMLIGNLTRDPELRYTPQGTAVCTFGLATNRSWMPADGSQRQEETEYHRIVAWAKLAEICSQLLYKGRKVYAEGRLQTRRFTGQDGNEREVTEVVIDSMIALGQPKSKEEGEDEYAYGGGEFVATPAGGQATPAARPAQVTQKPPAAPMTTSTLAPAAVDDDVVESAVAAEEETVETDKKPAKKATKISAKASQEEKAVAADDIPF